MQSEQLLTHYERIGGSEAVRSLVHRFYTIMDELPEAYTVRKLHGASLETSEEKLFKFLSGWLGGPQLFIEAYGHPMLRRRHMPFVIGIAERNQWLMCMNRALSEMIEDAGLRQELSDALAKVADHMRNQTDKQGASA